jgi:hypothetical protein
MCSGRFSRKYCIYKSGSPAFEAIGIAGTTPVGMPANIPADKS